MATLFTTSGILLLYNRTMSRDSSSEKEEEEQEHKIYIDERILAQNDFFLNNYNEIAPKFDTVYEINGEIFREENNNDNDLYLEFEVQLNDWNDDTTAVEKTETDDIYLDIISIEEINEGIILNSYIFLTRNQWNTLIVDNNYKFCFVCDDVIESLAHINMVAHIENLQRSRPLKKFDLAVTRLIGESYHCAVCNIIFNRNNDNDHFDGKSHKDKMEHARNQTIELTHNENNGNRNNDRNRINSFNSVLDYDSSEGFYDYDFNDDINLNNGNNDESISYASMAKKPNTTPKYITQTVGEKTYNVLFDHWHMVIYPKPNQFYCMTCKIFGHVSTKTTHCLEKSHTEDLSKCHFVEKYHRFLIRQMFSDFKFYHCGICNKLIVISQVDDHIATVHDKKYENIDISTPEKNNKIQNKVKERNINNDSSTNRNNDVSRNENNDTSNKFQKIESLNHNKMDISRELLQINNISPGLYNDIILHQFSCKLRISFVAYNVVLKSAQGFFCGICDIITNEDVMKYHIIDISHVVRLRSIPFETYFGSNLIRLINNRAHCSICNILFDNVSNTLLHVTSELHLSLLNQALKIPEVPTAVNPDDSINHNRQIDSNQPKNQPKMNMQDNKIKSNEHLESLDDSIESIENYEHEFLYLHFRNKNIKVTFNSYHSLVVIGDGTRYCFVCSRQIIGCSRKHIESRAHAIAMKKCKFLDKFDKHLLRQIYLHYHCCTCNVVFSKKYLNTHLTWPTQEDKTNRKMRKDDLNSGIKFLQVETQKEEIFLNMQESKIEIIGRIDIKSKLNNIEIKKSNKIIILASNVLKLSWDSWQGIVRKKSGYFCVLCDKDLKNFELNYHISEEWHANALENTFEKEYFPNLIRKVTDTTIHCLTCNLVIPNKKYFIFDHVNGKKHKITYDTIRDDSATVNSYSDCNDNVLYL